MADKKEMFESGLVKLNFFTEEDDVFNKAVAEIEKKERADKKAEKMANALANQKSGASK